MGIGLGIVLLVIGLVFAFDVVHIEALDKYVATQTLGYILIGVGVLALILSLVLNKQRGQTKHVEEYRVDNQPPPQA